MRAPDAAERFLLKADPVLAGVIRLVRRESTGNPELFRRDTSAALESLTRAIVAQQLSSKAASTIFARVRALVAGDFTAQRVLRLADADLRNAGLSGSKTRFVQELARADAAGLLDLKRMARWEDAQVLEHLTAIKGVGPWTAQMFLMFRLRRPDVLPVNDGGIQRAIELAYQRARPTPQQVKRIAAPWRPHATTACLFLWTALDCGLGRKAK